MNLIFIGIKPVSVKALLGGIGSILLVTLSMVAFAAPPTSQLTNRVIIKYNTTDAMFPDVYSSMLQNMSRSNKAALADSFGEMTGLQIRFARTLSTGADVFYLDEWMSHEAIEQHFLNIAEDSAIDYIEPDALMHHMLQPNDSRYNEQWHYFEATGGINLPAAWDVVTGDGVVVAVIDTGYRPHADLVANILPGYDMISDAFIAADGDGRDSDAMDPGDFTLAGECGRNQPTRDQNSSWHGTHVAGTIAAVTNNNTGVAGVAHNAKVLPIRVLGKCGGFTSDIADGMIWASGGNVSGVPANPNPAQVLNLSLGGGGACNRTQQNAIDIARSNGATVVVAAGNENTNVNNSSPANCSGVIAVAATDRSGGKVSFSNFGNKVDVAAPGRSILSTLNAGRTTPQGDSLASYSGTSMSAPHVAGLAALVYQANPGSTPAEVEAKIKNTTRPFPARCRQCGTGIVDAEAAILGNGGGGTLPQVTIEATDAEASEAGLDLGVLTFTRTGDSSSSLTLRYTVAGTATAGSDYRKKSGTVKIKPGQASRTIDIIPVNDTRVEGDETVVLTLSPNAAYEIGASEEATVTIRDDDTGGGNLPVVTVDATDAAASEAGLDPATLTFSRTGNTASTLTLRYAVSGTATAGSDYQKKTGVVKIKPGQASRSIDIKPINDSKVESDETVVLTLTANAAYEIGASGDATVIIIDDDTGGGTNLPVVTLSFVKDAQEAGRKNGRVRLERTGKTNLGLTVHYSVAGTAQFGTDYKALTGSKRFKARKNRVTFDIVPINDTLVEGLESVILTVKPDAAYQLGAADSATVNIIDND